MSRSHCPHCGRRYDAEVPTTPVRCGACDAAQDLIGRLEDLTGTTFFCDVCGELNLLPIEVDEEPSDDRQPVVADGGVR